MALCKDPSSEEHEHKANEVYTKQKDTYFDSVCGSNKNLILECMSTVL